MYISGLRGKHVYISKALTQLWYDISDIYQSGHTHLIGERTTDHSPHLFYILWFQLHRQIALRTLFLCHYTCQELSIKGLIFACKVFNPTLLWLMW